MNSESLSGGSPNRALCNAPRAATKSRTTTFRGVSSGAHQVLGHVFSVVSVLSLFLVLGFASLPAYGQAFGSIGGTVKDQSGAERVAAGAALPDQEIRTMTWLVDGVQGTLPKT